MNIFFKKPKTGLKNSFRTWTLSQRPYSWWRRKRVAFRGLHWLTGDERGYRRGMVLKALTVAREGG